MVSKKALAESVVVILIIVILGAVIAIMVLQNLFSGVGTTFDKIACQESISLKAQAKSLKLQENVPLKCSSQTLTFDSMDNINEEIAQAMFDCWDQFNQGKSDFLTDYEFGRYSTFCFKCSSINFDPSIKGNKLTLGNYVKITDIPEKPGTNYLKFFTGENIETPTNKDFINGLNNLDTNEELYIFFVAQKYMVSQVKSNSAIVLGSCAAGAAIVGSAGAAAGLGIGSIPGAIAGAKIGCIGGTAIATAIVTYRLTSEKEGYFPSMIIAPAAKAVQICNARSWTK